MFTVYAPLGIYCSSVPEDSSTPPIHALVPISRYLAKPPIQPKEKLPVGSDFKYVITKNMIYVDKTEIIHTMIEQEKYVFLSRPPRFGKSLLVSTLRYLFEGGPSNAKLFEGLKIKENFDWLSISGVYRLAIRFFPFGMQHTHTFHCISAK